MCGCGQKWAWESNFNEWINLAEFFDANIYQFKKAKSYFNSYWVSFVKYEWMLLGHSTLKSAVPQPKYKSMNWANFLHAGSDGIIFG